MTHQRQRTGLEVTNITKSFGAGAHALQNTSLKIEPGEMVALIGASGSGKSTLLRHVSGFLAADMGSGAIQVGSNTIQDQGKIASNIRAMRADIGFIFQQFNLVGRMNVLTNVLTGMLPRVPLWRSLLAHFTEAEKLEAYDALRVIGIEDLAYQRASTLSGGQQQRVAIARALALEPILMLFDEPTSALDPKLTQEVLKTIRDLTTKGMTMVLATHEMRFAEEVATQVIYMDQGSIIEQGTPTQIFKNPQKQATKEFISCIL